MRRIYLIKHAAPQMQPTVSSDRWSLSLAGRAAALVMAERLAGVEFAAIVSSSEPKAIETAGILSEQLNIPAEAVVGLHEHERRHVPVMRTPEYISQMAQVFKRPDEWVLGEETAGDALDRFRDAYDGVLKKYPMGDLAMVSHGTVIALFLASISEQDGFQLWRQMGLPSYAIIEEPGSNVGEIVLAMK